MLICNARIYNHTERRFFDGSILIKNGYIADIGEIDASICNASEIIDAKGRPIIPAFIDIHTHGRAGFDFVNVGADLAEMARDYAKHGVCTVMPTLASAPLEEMKDAARAVCTFKPKENEAYFCGVHFEGRWLSPEKKGAHATEMLAPLDANELEDEVFRMCPSLRISAAYELDIDGSFAKKARELSATLSLGHTSATFEQARAAEENGVNSYTHLFNAMPPLHHRDGGAICAAFLGNSFAELICDGIHISPEMVALAYKNLGNKRLVLISDSMEATGKCDGEYSIAGNPVTVKNGIALTHGGALAGSTLTLDSALQNLMRFANVPLTEALPCVTENPARAAGIFDSVGSISIGKRADLIILSDELEVNIDTVIMRGITLDVSYTRKES